jgi:F-type H+-transporting ATPase subunit epsilon
MANILKCDIVTPDKKLFSGEATLVSAPAAEGDIGFMYQNSPMMSTLRRGKISIKSDNDETTTFAVDSGYLEADGHKVVVLASRAINVNDIDTTISNERIARCNRRIEALTAENNPAIEFYKSELVWQEYLISVKSS